MKRILFRLFSLTAALAFVAACEQNTPSPVTSLEGLETNGSRQDVHDIRPEIGGKIVIADRASGTISVIDVRSDEVMATYELPAGENPAQPMYVVYDVRHQTVFVGDRGNNRVVAYDAGDFSVKGIIPAGEGVFHMWADPRGKQLWVNNDISNTITVIDPRNLSVLNTISIPGDLTAMGGKPHDVILDIRGQNAFVSFVGVAGASDYVVRYNTRTFSETGRVAVGKDPHLSLTQRNNLLYVPAQNSDAVYLIDRSSLDVVEILDVPGAHGAGMALTGKTFYTTNLPGGGPAGLWTIDVKTNMVISHTDTPKPVPHNIALTPDSRKLYITHSGGSSNTVSVYRIPAGQQTPEFVKEITVGFNPFGLAYAN